MYYLLIFPEDLRKEVSRFLHKKCFDVVLEELLLVTERLVDIPIFTKNCEITLLLIHRTPRWAYLYRVSDGYERNIYNILKLKKKREGKMQSLP